ncbi:hypothetical protein EVG20_g10761 [Dentipellis fragilis]|uniref:F-box only protein 9 n=1 Tax=Dentipellis fragilis TaxID=205917 RepID=A0A4Y9XS09_9AGAM|nr:hypothetical protein EVG20_g10761 [Dentipellis fragilis]
MLAHVDEEDEEDICGMAGILYAAGQETTVTVLNSFVLAMVLNPEVQRKAQEEIDYVFPSNWLPTIDDHGDLPYIEAVMKEVYRWLAPVPNGLPHAVMEDDVYNGYFIPKGTVIIPSLQQMCNDCPRPTEFLPHRFIDGTDRGSVPADPADTAIAQMLSSFEFLPEIVDGKECPPLAEFEDATTSQIRQRKGDGVSDFEYLPILLKQSGRADAAKYESIHRADFDFVKGSAGSPSAPSCIEVATAEGVEDPEELKKFREKWKAEVRRKRQEKEQEREEPKQVAHSASSAEPIPPTSVTSQETLWPDTDADSTYVPSVLEVSVASSSTAVSSATFVSNGAHLVRNRALDVYTRAVQCEQASQLDDALDLYRQAFRMDPDVDRAYSFAQRRAEAMQPITDRPAHRKSLSVTSSPEVEAITEGVKALKPPSASVEHSKRGTSGALTWLLETFGHPLSFEPEDEKQPCAFNSLPDELISHILNYLGPSGIERFAAISKKARVLTLDPLIWRGFCEAIYKPPQISIDDSAEKMVAELYASDYRRMYIEQPRVRVDGVYIAVCHYIRSGQSENAWVNISHLITYHRYLRFYPSGQVISLLANEEFEPQQVIPMLKPTLRMKGFHIGSWQLSGTTILVTNLVDPSSPASKYTFQMCLTLRSRPLGRWNKLDFDGYESVNRATGEASPFSLKNERAFWFSKVRSYGAV